MTKLLALETSGAFCSVAIHADAIWSEDTQNVQRMHNQVLLGQIDRVTKQAGVAAGALEVVAFGAGPGSFTGIRIAAATAQALAFAAGCLVVPVSSSRALAETALQSGIIAGAAGVVVVTRSRRDAHYVAAYAFVDGHCRSMLADVLHQGTAPPGLAGVHGWPGIGDRPPWWDDQRTDAPFLEGIATTAATIGRLALAIHAAGGAAPPEAALPVYVNGDSPWKPQPVPSVVQDGSGSLRGG